MNWWENEIDGYSLEWQNHESDNSLILYADLKDLDKRIEDYFGGTAIGISKNPPISKSILSDMSEWYAMCFDVNGDLCWSHITKDQFELCLEEIK